MTADLSPVQGCYGHVHEDILKRDGKVVRFNGDDVLTRDSEHAKCAELLNDTDLDSDFYPAFPTLPCKRSGLEEAQLGNWHELELVILLGFDVSDDKAVSMLCETGTSKRLLFWSEGHIEKIRNVGFRGCDELHEKQLHMVGYLFELIFDLMIARDDNVSKSPGFETPLGVFKR